ncbi:hypothetical protein CDAR_491561 [Caerostris darwini]|uniref:Uncharacterized protein n=1 Tax=Caerostris darwini TaxID=1538125 RepID=A0AAV4XAV4_9ARAC|nr:hypothetical protein CDAR_491561 [Caerostris darwini]
MIGALEIPNCEDLHLVSYIAYPVRSFSIFIQPDVRGSRARFIALGRGEVEGGRTYSCLPFGSSDHSTLTCQTYEEIGRDSLHWGGVGRGEVEGGRSYSCLPFGSSDHSTLARSVLFAMISRQIDTFRNDSHLVYGTARISRENWMRSVILNSRSHRTSDA